MNEFFIVIGAEAAVNGYLHRRTLARRTTRLFQLLRKGKCRIAVFGPSGTGKTTLGQYLTDTKFLDHSYRPSSLIETVRIPDSNFAELQIAPGQRRRILDTWPDLFDQLSAGKVRGIINVVSYGYHGIGPELSYRNTDPYKRYMKVQGFMPKYLQYRRSIELGILRTILKPRIIDAKAKIWMLTLVLKQDLWWEERERVRDYYTKGTYQRIIRSITEARGHRNFLHEYVSGALMINSFRDGVGTLLKANARGYDWPVLEANLANLAKRIMERIG